MVNPPEPDPRIDDLRQRLRSLGYLDAGVDRFVLGSARATRRPASIAALASLRIGALAAVLLGPAAAIGLSARLPGLVTGPRDALLVAIYIGVFFGLAVAAGALAASLLVSWIARRAGDLIVQRASLLSRIAGGAVTLLCLAYLTLWWETVLAGVGWSRRVDGISPGDCRRNQPAAGSRRNRGLLRRRARACWQRFEPFTAMRGLVRALDGRDGWHCSARASSRSRGGAPADVVQQAAHPRLRRR